MFLQCLLRPAGVLGLSGFDSQEYEDSFDKLAV